MNEVYLSLGSNKGDRTSWLKQAIGLISAACGDINRLSAVYETAAWGLAEQPDFLNMAVLLHTDQTPERLLADIHKIESALGRQREIPWGPRTLDIDILFYNHMTLNLPGFTIPHPFLQDRRFVLVPLAEIAPTYIHPVFNKTVRELLAACPDPLEVHEYTRF